MKKILVLVGVLVLVLGIAPWGIGRMVQTRIDRGQDTLAATAPYLTLVKRTWSPGWFSSTQDLTFEVSGAWLDAIRPAATLAGMQPALEAAAAAEAGADAGAGAGAGAGADADANADVNPADPAPTAAPVRPSPAQPLRITLQNKVLHGPVLWTSGLGLARIHSVPVLSDAVRRKLIELFGTEEPVRIVTRVGFLGGATITLSGDARSVKLASVAGSGTSDDVVSWDDFKIAVGMSATLDSYHVKGKQPRLEITSASDGTRFAMEDITLRGSGKRIVGELYDGDVTFAADRLQVTGKAAESFEIEDLEYTVDIDRQGEFLDYAMAFGSGAVESKQLGELGVQLKQVHYDVTVRRLHLATMDKLMTAIKASYARPVDVAGADAALLQTVKDNGIALLQHDPELVLDRIGITTSDGQGYLKGVIKLQGVTADDLNAGGVMALFGKIVADLTIEIDRSMLEKIKGGATMAGAAVDGGYLRGDGGKLVSHIQFSQGQLTVNGKAQGLPALTQPQVEPPTQP